MVNLFLLTLFVLSYGSNSYYPSGDCDDEWQDMVNFDVDADRYYFIGCVEEEWDYAPSGKNLLSGLPITEDSPEAEWLWGNGRDRIGSKYMKGLYREFTDSCHDTIKPPSKEDEHIGAIGPIIRALTDETIAIYYKNSCSFPNSMHAHGVSYDKTSEGAPYADGSKPGDIILPGDTWIYIWNARRDNVDEGASSKMWLYHSHVDEVRDLHTGLLGAIIITKKGYETDYDNLMPRDVVREFTTFFVLYDENESLLFDKNVDKYLSRPAPVDDLAFSDSNEMYSINGLLFGNLNTLTCIEGEKVRWYTASFGNEEDSPHSPHWHGNILVDPLGDHTDTVVLIAGTTYTTTMTIDQRGKWLYHCHVFDHITHGMITTYTAEEDKDYVDTNSGSSEGDHCCRGHLEPRHAGRCWPITDEDECDEMGRYCLWDSSDCQDESDIDCEYRSVDCEHNDECCSGYCNADGYCG